MHFLCLAYYDPQAMAAMSEPELAEIVKQCPAHDQALRDSGQLLLQASLGEPAETRVIRPRHTGVTDGPFTEAKELVGGFFIIEADDMNQAVRIASLHPAANIGDEIGWGVEVWPVGRLVRYDSTSA